MIDSTTNKRNAFFMKKALLEARKAYDQGEVPVGCVIVKDDRIVARGRNVREQKESVLAHAELIALDKAAKKLGSWRLDECDVYVTLEPCAMCAGALIQARIRRLVYGTREPKFGAHQSILNLFSYPFNHQVIVESGVLEAESEQLLKAFFQDLRRQKALKSSDDMI